MEKLDFYRCESFFLKGIFLGIILLVCIGGYLFTCEYMPEILSVALWIILGIFLFLLINYFPKRKLRPYLSISKDVFTVKNKTYRWTDIDFIHYSSSYVANRFGVRRLLQDNQKTLLVFIKGKHFPISINLFWDFTPEDAQIIVHLFNQFNINTDLWRSKLQRLFWE